LWYTKKKMEKRRQFMWIKAEIVIFSTSFYINWYFYYCHCYSIGWGPCPFKWRLCCEGDRSDGLRVIL
jgi:hypothetical protein